jgi:hypothetical protein
MPSPIHWFTIADCESEHHVQAIGTVLRLNPSLPHCCKRRLGVGSIPTITGTLGLSNRVDLHVILARSRSEQKDTKTNPKNTSRRKGYQS